MTKVIENLRDILEDNNYFVFSLSSSFLYIQTKRKFGAEIGVNLNMRRSVIVAENKSAVEMIFENTHKAFNRIIDEKTIISNLNSFMKANYSYFNLAISHGYQKKLKNFFRNNIENIEECFNESNNTIKEKKAKKIIDLMNYENLALRDKTQKEEFNNLTMLFMLINHCCEIKENICHTNDNQIYKKYLLEDLDIALLAYDAEISLDVPYELRKFHVDKLVEIAKSSKTKKFKTEVALQHLRQFDDLSFFEKYAPEIIGQDETDKVLKLSLNKLFVKEYIEGRPNLLLKLLTKFKDLKIFDEFLENKCENIKPNQKMLFLKILNLDYQRFKPIFEKYNLINKNEVRKATFELTEYELDIVNIMSKSICLNDYKEKILHTIDFLKDVFSFEGVKTKILEDKNILVLQIYYTSEQKKIYEEKEKFIMNEFLDNLNHYLPQINKETREKLKREINLKFELSKVDETKQVKIRKKL